MNAILKNTKAIFSEMTKNGWDVNAQLKYGFFFYCGTSQPLKDLFSELEGHGYKMDSIEKLDGEWKMVVHKVDMLNPEKLHKRNLAFNELAECLGVDYDGWDVEQL
ncbi:ribonuclease E inhibitor RraB [Dyadobacter jiangsuensis]